MRSLAVAVALMSGASSAAELAISLEPSLAISVSQPQASYFGVGGGGVLGVHLGLASFFELQAQAAFFALPQVAGAPVLGPTSLTGGGLGARVHLPWANRVVPWLDAAAHYTNTGGLSRLALTAGVGVLIALDDRRSFFVGAHARLYQVFKLVDEPGFLNRDGTLITPGLTVLLRFPPEDAPSGDGDADQDGVMDTVDSCPKEPGPAPSGCPLRDADGDLVPDSVDACPHQPGLSAFGGCPDPDPDKDGVHSPADKCPTEPEDRDSFEDGDGCPEPDNDGDGVLDGVDSCPLVAGPAETKGCPDADKDTVSDPVDQCPHTPGPAANQGCPQYKQVVVTEAKLEIRQKIFFAFGKSDILPKSFELLDEVTRALTDHERLCVRIEGHTDAVGGDAKNLKLSKERAASVRAYLTSHGIANVRLTSEGYGPTQPLETNATPEGRERNRRVEFVLVSCSTGN